MASFLIFLSLYILHFQGILSISVSLGQAVEFQRTGQKDYLVNFKPLIGIVSQPGDGAAGEVIDNDPKSVHRKLLDADPFNGFSYIAASYVKWVEMAGARVIPIIYNEPREIIEKKLKAINGLLFPGGGKMLQPDDYFDTMRLLYSNAKAANDAGEYFPLQATCLGLETVVILVSDNFDALDRNFFNASNFPSTVSFTSEWAKSRYLFGWLDDTVKHSMETTPLTMENHHDGNSLENFRSNKKLMDFFHLLTTSSDREGKVYVSSVEGKNYPFYGTQWHPEKVEFEWGIDVTPHSPEAVKVAQAAADFFVNEARKNQRRANGSEVEDFLIYNYDPLFSGKLSKSFEQVYLFHPNSNTKSKK